jgi:nitrogen regulatory protein P-II 1
MKKAEATIRPSDLQHVKKQLADAGVRSVVVLAASCLGDCLARRVYRGSTYVVDAAPCIRLDVVVTDEQLGGVVDVLRPAVDRGPLLDGSIVVMSLEQVPTRVARTPEPSKRLPDMQVIAQEPRGSKGQDRAGSIRGAAAQGDTSLGKSTTA